MYSTLVIAAFFTVTSFFASEPKKDTPSNTQKEVTISHLGIPHKRNVFFPDTQPDRDRLYNDSYDLTDTYGGNKKYSVASEDNHNKIVQFQIKFPLITPQYPIILIDKHQTDIYDPKKMGCSIFDLYDEINNIYLEIPISKYPDDYSKLFVLGSALSHLQREQSDELYKQKNNLMRSNLSGLFAIMFGTFLNLAFCGTPVGYLTVSGIISHQLIYWKSFNIRNALHKKVYCDDKEITEINVENQKQIVQAGIKLMKHNVNFLSNLFSSCASFFVHFSEPTYQARINNLKKYCDS